MGFISIIYHHVGEYVWNFVLLASKEQIQDAGVILIITPQKSFRKYPKNRHF